MRAWLLEALTGLSALKLVDDLPDPVPAPGQVVLQLSHAALNPADRYLAENQYPAKPTFPHILGRDGIGKVVAVGGGMTGVRIGDVRLILRGEAGVNKPGTFAGKVVVQPEDLTPKPAGWTDEEAAGAALTYLTAWQAITQWEDLAPNKFVKGLDNKTVLITGASGGVGVASVQLAAAMGARVVALSRDENKRKKLAAIGAALTLDPSDELWKAELKSQSGDRRVDLAIDSVGGAAFNSVLDTLGASGRVSVVGRLAGPVPAFNTANLFTRRIRIGGVFVSTYTPSEAQNAWRSITQLLATDNAKPLVDQVFEFGSLVPAFTRLADGPMGKVVLKIGSP